MTDHPRIPLAGVLGHPIAHSRSPALHGYWLRRYGLKGFYIPIDVAPADLGDVVRMLPRMGFAGVNVTIPHKEAILNIADIITDRAALIGAANTLIFRKDGKIHADNTDGSGFIANLRQNAPQWQPQAGYICKTSLIGCANFAFAGNRVIQPFQLRQAQRSLQIGHAQIPTQPLVNETLMRLEAQVA